MVNTFIAAYTETCRRLDVSPTPLAMLISVPSQAAILLNQNVATNNYELSKIYVISTSRFGVGQQKGSRRTPLGLHRVAEKFGDGLPTGTIFKGRKSVGQITKDFDAIALCCGSELPRDLPVAGRDLKGVHFAMEFLPQQNRRVSKTLTNLKYFLNI